MHFNCTQLNGVFIVEPQRREDDRGFFARTWCVREFAERGLNSRLVQCSISYNRKVGTLRGLHFQVAPHAEAKLVRCTQGALYDVVVDLRPDSPTFRQWLAVELTGQDRRMLYIPEGLAHGFQTLADDTEVFYQMSDFYCADCASGVRWNDPAFGIDWPPATERIISDKDRSYPDFHVDAQP